MVYQNRRPENAWVVWIIECASCGLQTCNWFLALSRCRMAKPSKRSRSKDNSLLPAKGFDNTMVDNDFEELQHGVSEESIIWHHFNGWAAVMVPCAGRIFEELHTFLRVGVRFFRVETTLRLLKIIIHHGEIKPPWWVAGCCLCYENAWRKSWPFYVD